jgi:glycosyltransferase involved in cell wall biosynthesis
MPKLSIIIPVYNTERYLKQCVDSVLNQEYRDFELWLIDDGSKDTSIDIIKSYAAKDSRVKAAFIHGSGPAVPRNYGLMRATGDYVLFIDSDDYIPEGALQTLVDCSERFPHAEFVKGNLGILTRGGGEKMCIC